MNGYNRPKPVVKITTKSEVKLELIKGFLIALCAGALFFYFIAVPAPFLSKIITQYVNQSTEETAGDGLRSGDLQFQELSSCMLNGWNIVSPVSHGKKYNWSNFDTIGYVMDNGYNLKVYLRDYLTCDPYQNYPRQIDGQRQANATAGAAIGNITGGDWNELVVSSQNKVEAYDLNGNQIWAWQPQAGETVDFSPPILADFHNTMEGLEVLASGHQGTNLHLYYLNGINGQLMTPATHITLPNVSSKNSVAVADITDDYKPVVIIAGDTKLSIYNNQGVIKKQFDLPSTSLHTPPMVITENNPMSGYVFIGYNQGSQTTIYGWHHLWYFGAMDYLLELLDEGYPYWDSNHQNTFHWPITVNGNIDLTNELSLTFANLTDSVNPVTNTENPDIVFVTNDNKLHGFSFFGQELFSTTIPGPVNKNSQPVAYDYDNDGRDEIFVATSNRVWAFEQNGTLINNIAFPLYLEDYWGSGPEFKAPLSIVYNGQHDWPIFSIPVQYANGSAAWQFTVWTIGEEYSQPSFAGPRGSIYNTNTYNFCRIGQDKAMIGDCLDYYSTTHNNSFCHSGMFESNCHICGCPTECYMCGGPYNMCNYTCGGPWGGDGCSPVMLKAPCDATMAPEGGGD